jgi:hypothetical protein
MSLHDPSTIDDSNVASCRATPDDLAVTPTQIVSTLGKLLPICDVVGEVWAHPVGDHGRQIASTHTVPVALDGLRDDWEADRLPARGECNG